MAKRIIRLFGFPVHDAPGEAEAECALLQQQGIVDAVLSEDVDTIMFGCTRTLRNWTAEGVRGAKTPTHVSLYDVDELLSGGTGLDREGMVLVALMSGGDYIPEGVPGCGIKVAYEAAKAGFGKSLCRLKSDDDAQFEEWRASLKHELRSNDSGFFRVRHKALSIPEEFPNRQVLRHYTHPVVSNAATIARLKTSVTWSRPVDVQGLRYFAEETFDWVNKIGAVKLTRVLSPGLLVQRLLERHMSDRSNNLTVQEMEREESVLITRISGQRSHHSTDGILELRVAHIPAGIVGLDLSQELDEAVSFDRQGLALNSDDEFEAATEENVEATGSGTREKSTFDPTVPELIWLPESLVKLSVPLTVEDWEAKQRSKAIPRAASKVNKKKTIKTAPPEAGALDKWVHVTKSATATTRASQTAPGTHVDSGGMPSPITGSAPRSVSPPRLTSITASQRPSPFPGSTKRSKQTRSNGKATAAEPTGHRNPWAYAGSQHMPRITKSQQPSEPILLPSSPVRTPPAPACSPLIAPPSREIIDLSGPDDTDLLKVRKSYQPASRAQQSSKQQSVKVSSLLSSNPPPKSKRAMRQMRMDSFILSPPRQSGFQDNLTRQNDAHNAEPLTCTSVRSTENVQSVGLRGVNTASESQVDEILTSGTDDDILTTSKVATSGRIKKMIVPRKSAGGFFKVVELSEQEDDGSLKTTSYKCSTRSAWGQSCVSVIDLTGND
ncbi:DNA repair protein complementing XP-G cells-like protein [Colletotrichum chlorophyti]|uniref:DNA repair protein complementing XP-G cells-like protein n=1 Tax=Colletotrichum chlorophyti TaxID=708187 RepID=A0A1Q8S1N5_9PEZI|nr:DNA repair protein complementing XP-G cells-like protein [Colletotrichum chlorophyti]